MVPSFMSLKRRLTRLAPMKPAEPVIKIVFIKSKRSSKRNDYSGREIIRVGPSQE